MPRNPRSRKRQRRQPLAPKPEPEPEVEVEPESEPEIVRLYGDETGDTFVDYETTNPQSQCGLLSKLPAEIRALIYQELWREAGLSQHLLPHTVFTEEFGVTRYHHARCITEHDAPDDRGPPPGNIHYKESKRRRLTDPSFTDGTDSRWKEDCYHCQYSFDCFFDIGNRPSRPVEQNTFLPILLSCKTIYLEAFRSVSENICFNFLSYHYAVDFLSIRLPIVSQLRQILLAEELKHAPADAHDWGLLVKALRKLPNLRLITFWLDSNRRWRNNKPREPIKHPRLCAFFAQIPRHVELKVSVPSDALDDTEKEDKFPQFLSFVKTTGGFVEGATMDKVLGV